MDEPLSADAARLRALRADNERQRALTIEAHERALAFAKRCDALEAERVVQGGGRRRRLWPFGRGA